MKKPPFYWYRFAITPQAEHRRMNASAYSLLAGYDDDITAHVKTHRKRTGCNNMTRRARLMLSRRHRGQGSPFSSPVFALRWNLWGARYKATPMRYTWEEL